jgi:hypothetical protein
MEGFDFAEIAVVIIAAVGGVVAVWIGKGFKKIEALVAESSNKIDDKALEVVKNGLREALKEDPAS